MNGVTSSTPSEGAVGDRHRIGVREMTNKSTLLRNIIGGAIFVWGIVSLDAQLGHKSTMAIVIMFIGLMVGTGIGWPDAWRKLMVDVNGYNDSDGLFRQSEKKDDYTHKGKKTYCG